MARTDPDGDRHRRRRARTLCYVRRTEESRCVPAHRPRAGRLAGVRAGPENETGQGRNHRRRRLDDRHGSYRDRARRHRLRRPRADARGQARNPRRRSCRQRLVERAWHEIATQAERAHRRARASRFRGTDRDPAAVAVRHAGRVRTAADRVKALFRARSERRRHRRHICCERTGRAGCSRRRCGARLVERRHEHHRLRLVRQADLIRSRALEVARAQGYGHRERTVSRHHCWHRPRGFLCARHRVSGRHDQYGQAGNTGRNPGTGARCETRTACRARHVERTIAGVDRPHRARARQRCLHRSFREAELLGQSHRRGGQRVADVGQTGW